MNYIFSLSLADESIRSIKRSLQLKNTMYTNLLSIILIASLTGWCYTNNSQPLTESANNPIDAALANKICLPTISEVPKSFAGLYCRGDLIFSDDFDTINSQYWINEIRLPSTAGDAEFVLYNGTLGIESGVLKIEASLNKKNLKRDSIDLGTRCTSPNEETECSLNPRGALTLPPIISGRLSTRNHFNFKYGRIEVRAKMPIGDWLYPLISLRSSSPSDEKYCDSGEIRVAFIHGNLYLEWQNKSIDGGRLYGGAIVEQDAESRLKFMKDITLPNVKHFGDDFHLYSLTWTPDQLIMTVDGNEYGRISTNTLMGNRAQGNAPLDKMFHITLGLAAGGHGDFPDTEGKPWVNKNPRGSIDFNRHRSSWYITWVKPFLEVDYVKVYAI